MPGRFRLRAQALGFMLAAMACGALTAFIWVDEPLKIPRMEAIAQATEADSPGLAKVKPLQAKLQKPLDPFFLPAGFQPHWETVSLDGGRVALRTLREDFGLAQTHRGLGAEYYDYAAFTFEQMADRIQDAELSERLKVLSLQAQGLGHRVRQAGDRVYDGPAADDFSHLQVRAAILSQLETLNPDARMTALYNQDGKLLSLEQSKAGSTGQALSAFMATADNVLGHPQAARYPESMALVRKHAQRLEKLTRHLALRWDSTRYCRGTCDGPVTRVHVYLHQTLPAQPL